MKDTGINQGLIQSFDTVDKAGKKAFFGFRKMFWDYLNKLNVPFYDTCCTTAATSFYPVRSNSDGTLLEYYNAESGEWEKIEIDGGGDTTLDTSFEWSVLSIENTPPVGAVSGDKYLIGTSPTGAYVGSANKVGTYDGSIYTYETPDVGDLLYNAATDLVYKWDGAVWTAVGTPALHQGGDTFGSTVIVGSNDDQDVSIEQNNVVRFRIDKGSKAMYATAGSHIIFPASTGIGWGDMNNGIYGDGSAYMVFDTYVGRWKWKNSQTGIIKMLLEDSQGAINVPMIIGDTGGRNPAAMLELTSTIKGFLPSRMTTVQRNAMGGGWLTGTITNAGSGYTNGSYTFVDFTGGTGTAFQANLSVAGGIVTSVTPTIQGRGFHVGDVLTAVIPGGSGFQYTVNTIDIQGLIVYDTDKQGLYIYDTIRWNPIFQGGPNFVAKNYADDAAAAVGTVAVGEFYHTSGAVKVRLT